MEIVSMSNEEIKNDQDSLIVCLRFLSLLEFVNNNKFKSIKDIKKGYIELVEEEDKDYQVEFKMFRDVIEQHIINSLDLLEKEKLIQLHNGVYYLTTEGLNFYKEKSELRDNKVH